MPERRTRRINDRMRIDSLTAILWSTLRNPFQEPSLRVCTVCVHGCMHMCIHGCKCVTREGRGPKSIFLCHPPPLFLRQSFHWTWSSLMGWAVWPVSDSGNLPVSAVLSSPSPQRCGYKNELSCLAFHLGSGIWTQVLRLTCKSFLLNHLPSPQCRFCESLHYVLSLPLFTCPGL